VKFSTPNRDDFVSPELLNPPKGHCIEEPTAGGSSGKPISPQICDQLGSWASQLSWLNSNFVLLQGCFDYTFRSQILPPGFFMHSGISALNRSG
jgi:hypothetical protein